MATPTSQKLPTSLKPPHIREFTPRSVAVGLLVALVIGASYPYVVLKFGFGPNISVVSAFFGFMALGVFSKNYNRWENNIVQTAGTTAGQIAFLCWLLAAFDILAAEPGSGFDVHLTRLQTFVWLSASGVLGVLLAVPLRRHFIEDENLPFPDGIAAGETLIMLDSRGEQARKSAFVMFGALVLSGLTFLATQLRWIVDNIPLAVNAFSARVGLGFGVSLLNIGSGMIIGLRISASMLIGGIIGWVIAPPWLLSQGLIAADARRVDILLLIMWPAVGMLVAGRHVRIASQMGSARADVQGARLVCECVRRSAASLGLDRGSRGEHLPHRCPGVLLWHAGLALRRCDRVVRAARARRAARAG